LFINGDFVEPKEKKVISIINPSTESEICKISEGSEADIEKAIDSAIDAFK